MIIEVRLEGHLRHLQPQRMDRLLVEMPSGSTIRHLIDRVGVPWAEVGAAAINGRAAPESTVLAEGDAVTLLAPLAGG